MNQRFPKSMRILRPIAFRGVLRHGQEFKGDFLLFHVQVLGKKGPKLGITVSKRFGKAHDRNRFKRLVREVFRRHSRNFSCELMIHVKPYSPRNLLNYHAIEGDFRQLAFSYIPKSEGFLVSSHQVRN